MTALVLALLALLLLLDSQRREQLPLCRWCNSHHLGRCIFNPRAGRVFANTTDGHFDYNDPNK